MTGHLFGKLLTLALFGFLCCQKIDMGLFSTKLFEEFCLLLY